VYINVSRNNDIAEDGHVNVSWLSFTAQVLLT